MRMILMDIEKHRTLAIIIADHSHIVTQAYRVLNQIRIQAMNRVGPMAGPETLLEAYS